MERYERILTISERKFQQNCPVIFEKGALLRDNKFERNILQLKFRSIGLKRIKAVYILILCLDIEKQQVENVEKKYLDLDISYDGTFGDKFPIELQNDLSRNYEFSVKKIVFYDDSISEYTETMQSFEKNQNINVLGMLKDQFVRELQKVNSSIQYNTKPTESNGIWYCACGTINSKENDKCGKCGFKKDKLFSLLDTDFLVEKKSEYLKQKEEEEKERKRQEELRAEEWRLQEEARIEKRKRLKKTAVIVVIIVIILGVIYYVVITSVVPATKYSSALKNIENGAYERGYQILTELGDYKDSSEQILAGKYKQGLECINSKEYEKGYEILESLGDYSDASEQILISKYNVAQDYMKYGYYKAAIDAFKEISDYSDSREQLKEARYLYAKYLRKSYKYEDALEQLSKIKDYKDVNDLYIEYSYEFAEKCFDWCYYIVAIEYYKKVGDYKDSHDKILEAKYRYVKENITKIARDEQLIYSYLSSLKNVNYKDAKILFEEQY